MMQQPVVEYLNVRCVALSRDCLKVAFGLDQGLYVYDRQTKTKSTSKSKQPFAIDKIKFSQDGTLLLTITDEGGEVSGTSKLIIWRLSDFEIMATSSIKFQVVNIEQTANIIVVSTWHKLCVLQLASLSLLYIDQICDNTKGIFSVSQQPVTIAFPKLRAGAVKIIHFKLWRQGPFVSCHQSNILALGISNNGLRFVTCSQKRQTMRIWSSQTGQKLQQVWLSNKKLTPIRVTFNKVGDWVSVLSTNGRLKIYSCGMLEEERKAKKLQPSNPVPMLSFLSIIWESLGEEQEFGGYELGNEVVEDKYDVGIVNNDWNIVHYLEPATKVFVLKFDPIHGGNCYKSASESVDFQKEK